MTSPQQSERTDSPAMPSVRRRASRRISPGPECRSWPVVLLLCLLLLAGGVAAAERTPPLRDYAVDMWTSRDGLPHNSLRGIA